MDDFKTKILTELDKRDYSNMAYDEIAKAASIYSTVKSLEANENIREMFLSKVLSNWVDGMCCLPNSEAGGKAE